VVSEYGLGVSVWNVPWPSNQTKQVFARMPRVDAIFGEDGEDGGGATTLEDAAAALRVHHPAATAWHDPGGRNRTDMARWFAFLEEPATRGWLDGVVYGPGILGGAPALLAQLPAGYVVRLYPDLSHTLTAMLPVPDWHFAWAFTAGRQMINPLPRHYGDVIRTFQNRTFRKRVIGFGGYSEGAADDLNKMLFSALYLEPGTSPDDFVLQYTRLVQNQC